MYSNRGVVSRRRGRAFAVDSHLAQVFLCDMRAEAPPLLPIFRSRLQGELLARLLLGPVLEIGLLDLARLVRGDLATVSREVTRLAKTGVLRLRRVTATGAARGGLGGGWLVTRNDDSPVTAPLAMLLMITFGPVVVVDEEFARVRGAREVHVFGAWASRYCGVEGEPPRDVDVLVIGDVERAELYAAADRAESRLGLSVNPVVRTVAQWRSDGDPFLREIRSGDLVEVFGRPLATKEGST